MKQSCEGIGSIVFEDVDLEHDGVKILEGINFTVKEPRVHALMGASGSGKSTILNLLTRQIDAPVGTARSGWRRAGAILIDGRCVRSYEEDALRREIPVVRQHSVAFPGTLIQNVQIVLMATTDLRGRALTERAEQALEMTGLAEEIGRLDIPVDRLSGGQLQRLAIARALAGDPSVMGFDEPTSALDPIARDRVEAVIRDCAEKRPVLLVTHDFGQALRLNARVLFLDGSPARGEPSRLVCNGMASDLLAKPAKAMKRFVALSHVRPAA